MDMLGIYSFSVDNGHHMAVLSALEFDVCLLYRIKILERECGQTLPSAINLNIVDISEQKK